MAAADVCISAKPPPYVSVSGTHHRGMCFVPHSMLGPNIRHLGGSALLPWL